jgi:hypothetical protein
MELLVDRHSISRRLRRKLVQKLLDTTQQWQQLREQLSIVEDQLKCHNLSQLLPLLGYHPMHQLQDNQDLHAPLMYAQMQLTVAEPQLQRQELTWLLPSTTYALTQPLYYIPMVSVDNMTTFAAVLPRKCLLPPPPLSLPSTQSHEHLYLYCLL